MHASATLLAPDGTTHVLGHGDLVGRVWSAALSLDDARVSEAHAMVSLRGAELKLLALRGMLAVDGRVVSEVVLEPGQVVALARGVRLEVVEVVVPERVLAVVVGEAAPIPLSGVCSVVARPVAQLRRGVVPEAVAVFHEAAEGWRVTVDGQAAPLEAGWTAPEGVARVVWLEPQGTGQSTRAVARLDAPLRLVLRYDTVLIHRDGAPVLRLTGRSAQILSELGTIGGPVHWEPLARQLWTDAVPAFALRRRFDSALSRTRRKLEEAGLSRDLVRSDHSGLFELVLRPGDELVDET